MNSYILSVLNPGGGGGTQIWFRRGCAAEAAKPVPIFKGHFGRKGYPLLGFLFRKMTFLCTLATKWAKISSIDCKITKLHPMFRDFSAKPYPMFRDFLRKSHPLELHTPYTLLGEYPPPPPGFCIGALSRRFSAGSFCQF